MAGPRLRAWAAVIRVIDAPGQVFHYLAEEPAWLPPYLASTLLGIAAVALSLPVTLRFMEAQFAERGLDASSFMTNWMIVGGVVGAFVGPTLAGLFVSAVVFGLLWIVGEGVSFRGVFCAIGYARLPLSMGVLVNAFLITSATSFNQVKQLSVSAAALVPNGASPFLISLLSTLAPFDMWYFVLVALGVAGVARCAVSKVWWVAVVLYGLNLLIVMLGTGLSTVSF